jgi:hypothetical protein
VQTTLQYYAIVIIAVGAIVAIAVSAIIITIVILTVRPFAAIKNLTPL